MDYQPATHSHTDRPLGRLPSGREVAVTVHRYAGGDGPTVYVQAAQHGIELNGVAALRRLHDRLDGVEIAGTVVLVPVVNPLAFDHRSYTTPAEYDALNPNFNRVWPGDADGSFQERLADRLWDLVATADAVVDLHTGTADMLEHVRYPPGVERAAALARAFGVDYVMADSDDTGSDPEFSGKFRTAAARSGIPAVTAELANSREVAHDAIETGVDGVCNVLRQLDVLRGEAPADADQTHLRNDLSPVLASESGLFELRQDVGVGDRLAAGTELGTVYDPSTFEPRQTVTTDQTGIAYSLAREAVVVAGERVAGLASEQ